MTTAAIYLRVSTSQQAEDGKTSIPEQRRTLIDIAERNGWEYHVHEEVGSAGDGAAGLPKLTQILGEVMLGNYQVLLVYHLDRLSRAGVGEGERIKAILAKQGCELVTPGGRYDLRSEGDDLRSDVEWMFAKLEHRKIFRRTHMGIEARAKTGEGRLGHPMPFGYRTIYTTEGTPKIEIVEHEAAVIRRAYDLYLTRQGGFTAIATKLAEEGFVYRGGRKIWYSAVAYWLRNPRYAGQEFRRSPHTRWRDYKRKFATSEEHVQTASLVWPAIVSLDEWTQAQEVYKNNRENQNPQTESPLGGILRCRLCGGRMNAFFHKSSNTRWYRCTSRIANQTCKGVAVHAEEAHLTVYRWIKRMLTEGFPNVRLPEDTSQAERDAIEAELAKTEHDEDTLTDLVLQKAVTIEMANRKTHELLKKRTALQERLRAIRQPNAHGASLMEIPTDALDEISPSYTDPLFVRLVRSVVASVVLEPANKRSVRNTRGARITRQTYRLYTAQTVSGHIYAIDRGTKRKQSVLYEH